MMQKQQSNDDLVRWAATCKKEMAVSGIYDDDNGVPYLEVDNGVEITLAQLFSSFKDEIVTIKIKSQEEVPI